MFNVKGIVLSKFGYTKFNGQDIPKGMKLTTKRGKPISLPIINNNDEPEIYIKRNIKKILSLQERIDKGTVLLKCGNT